MIQPSTSAWASPIVLVKKRDGTQRFCVDYRKLNAVTKRDVYPLPRIDDILDTLGKSRYFTTFGSAFWLLADCDGSSHQRKISICYPQRASRVRENAIRAMQCPCYISKADASCSCWNRMEGFALSILMIF